MRIHNVLRLQICHLSLGGENLTVGGDAIQGHVRGCFRRPAWTRSCPARTGTCWSWMNSGASSAAKRRPSGRDQPRRALVWHVAGQNQPPGAPGLLLFQMPGEPPGRHPPLHHHLQPCCSAASNSQVITTITLPSIHRALQKLLAPLAKHDGPYCRPFILSNQLTE